jgi:hypothetical protein
MRWVELVGMKRVRLTAGMEMAETGLTSTLLVVKEILVINCCISVTSNRFCVIVSYPNHPIIVIVSIMLSYAF